MSSQNISILPYILPKVTAGNYKIEVSSKNNFGARYRMHKATYRGKD